MKEESHCPGCQDNFRVEFFLDLRKKETEDRVERMVICWPEVDIGRCRTIYQWYTNDEST